MALLRRKHWESIRDDFEKAINAAARAGFLQDRAIAHLLLGEYFLTRGVMEFDAKSHLASAHALFSEWGAKVVAIHLHHVHSSILTDQTASSSSRTRHSETGVKARSRFRGLTGRGQQNSTKSELLSRSLSSMHRPSKNRGTPGNRR